MQWLAALGREKLDLTIDAARGFTSRIVERPALWMDEAELAALVSDLRAVARRVAPDGELGYGALSGDRDRLANSVITLVRERDSGRPVAFNALAIMDVTLRGKPAEVLHLGLVMVDPGVRSQGLSWVLYGLTCFLLFLRGGFRPVWISNVTQVPAVVGMVSETFTNVYPTPDKTARSYDHSALAREIMERHRSAFGVGADAWFDAQRFVICNAYTGGSDDLKKQFDDTAKHRDPRYNAMCQGALDYARGDDFLQIGQINGETARDYLLKQVPRDSAPSLLVHAFFLMAQAALLPLVYWLQADRSWGSLRPWRG